MRFINANAVIVASLIVSGSAFAGKIDPTKVVCTLQDNVVTSELDGTKIMGSGNFCTSRTAAKMKAVENKRQGFGEGVAGVTPGFIPPVGSSEYGVEQGDKYFWVFSVNNDGTTPADGQWIDTFPPKANVLGVYFKKGNYSSSNQLPFSEFVNSKDASVKWTIDASNNTVRINVFQAPPGPGTILLYLEQQGTAGTKPPATK